MAATDGREPGTDAEVGADESDPGVDAEADAGGREPGMRTRGVLISGWACELVAALCLVAMIVDVVFFVRFCATVEVSAVYVVLFLLLMASLAACVGISIPMGKRAIQAGEKPVSKYVNRIMLLLFLALLFDTFIFAITLHQIIFFAIFGIVIAVSTFIEPQLAAERQRTREMRGLSREQRDEKRAAWRAKQEAQAASLDRVERVFGPHRTLNFYNLFWMFTVWSVIGILIENTFYYIVTDGGYTARYGMLFGPFAPIYGFGACAMSAVMNRYHDRSLLTIFLMCAAIGGFFEFFMSWAAEYAFGISSWDYSGTWLSLAGGRTSGMFMIGWGLLGVAWVKVFLPLFLELVDLVPWKVRYATTAVAFVLMLINGIMTFQAVGCWYARESGKVPQTEVEQFYAQNFDDDFMRVRFENMTLHPNSATRDV